MEFWTFLRHDERTAKEFGVEGGSVLHVSTQCGSIGAGAHEKRFGRPDICTALLARLPTNSSFWLSAAGEPQRNKRLPSRSPPFPCTLHQGFCARRLDAYPLPLPNCRLPYRSLINNVKAQHVVEAPILRFIHSKGRKTALHITQKELLCDRCDYMVVTLGGSRQT